MKTVDKICPGDCSKCTLPQEIPGFDFYGCVLHQIFQKTIKLEKDFAKLEKEVRENENKEQIFINNHKLEDDGTDDAILPEPKRQKRVLDE